MPTPLIHASVASVCAHVAGLPQLNRRAFWLMLFAANMADLDIIPGIIAGNRMLYHHLQSHSPFFGLCAALLISTIPWESVHAAGPRTPWKTRLAFLAAAAITHPFLDLLTFDYYNTFKGGPNGIMLAWPLTDRRWDTWRIFTGLDLNGPWLGWINSGNFKIVATEGALGAALIACIRLLPPSPEPEPIAES